MNVHGQEGKKRVSGKITLIKTKQKKSTFATMDLCHAIFGRKFTTLAIDTTMHNAERMQSYVLEFFLKLHSAKILFQMQI